MNKRQRKKKILNGLSTEERYSRTHCPICKEKIGVFDKYFNKYGEVVDSEVKLAATVSIEEASGALKEIALSWPSAEYNSNGEIRGISRLRL